jgi:hypothetical protein
MLPYNIYDAFATPQKYSSSTASTGWFMPVPVRGVCAHADKHTCAPRGKPTIKLNSQQNMIATYTRRRCTSVWYSVWRTTANSLHAFACTQTRVHLSKEMSTKLMILAVLADTSMTHHTLHNRLPIVQW